MLWVIIVVGIVTGMFIQAAVLAAFQHQNKLSSKWKTRNPNEWDPHPPVRGELENPLYDIFHSRRLPFVFIVSWIFVGVFLASGYFCPFGPEKKQGVLNLHDRARVRAVRVGLER